MNVFYFNISIFFIQLLIVDWQFSVEISVISFLLWAWLSCRGWQLNCGAWMESFEWSRSRCYRFDPRLLGFHLIGAASICQDWFGELECFHLWLDSHRCSQLVNCIHLRCSLYLGCQVLHHRFWPHHQQSQLSWLGLGWFTIRYHHYFHCWGMSCWKKKIL